MSDNITETPHPGPAENIGDTFWIPLDSLAVDLESNMREVDRKELYELAASMRPIGGVGQLQPILVVWSGDRYAVAVGFRRTLAMLTYRAEMGFKEIWARRIRPEMAATARLVENLQRENPSSFETCRYLWEVTHGLNGHAKLFAADLAEVIGRSTGHVKKLARFYGVLPDDLRQQWKSDRDERFTFRVLIKIAALAQVGNEAALRAKVAEMLGARAKAEPDPIAVGHARAAERRPRFFISRQHFLRGLDQLEALGEERLREDDRAIWVRDVLRSIADRDPKRYLGLVQQLRNDLGV